MKFAVIVVSDQVFYGEKKDVSGEEAHKILEDKGHRIEYRKIVPNDPKQILKALRDSRDSDAIILIGGTGPGPRDITVDVVEDIAWRKIPGFGELFRIESYREIGGRGLASRSELYLLYDGKPVAVLPGSPGAVRLGLRILLEMIEHLVEEAKRVEGPHRIHH